MKLKVDISKIKDKATEIYQGHKRLVWIGAGLLATAIITLVVFLPKEETIAEGVQYMEVIHGSVTESIGEVGTVEAEPSAVLTWSSGGIVGEYDLEVGNMVNKDDVLMELEYSSWPNDSLEAQTGLLAAELELENTITSEAELQTALLAVNTAEWKVTDEKKDLDFWNFENSSDEQINSAREAYYTALNKKRDLESEYELLRTTLEADDPDLIAAYEALEAAQYETNVMLGRINDILGYQYDQKVETAFLEYDQALAELEQARAEYIRLVDDYHEVSAAQAGLQAYKNTINKARIIAPFDGTITEISYLAGEYAEAGSIAVQVDDLSSLVVNVTVTEIEIDLVEIGQQVEVTFEAIPFKEYAGEITSISSAGLDESGTVEFAVSVSILNADEDIRPGFTAEVNIITSRADDALLVPTQALRGQNGKYMVMVADEDGTTTPVRVEVGASSDDYSEVLSGDLEQGDRLAVVISSNDDEFTGPGFGMMGPMGGGGGRPPGRD